MCIRGSELSSTRRLTVHDVGLQQCSSSLESVDAYVEELTEYFVALSSARTAAQDQAGEFHEVVAVTSKRLYEKIVSASEEVEAQQKVQIDSLMDKLSLYHAEVSPFIVVRRQRGTS